MNKVEESVSKLGKEKRKRMKIKIDLKNEIKERVRE